MHPIFDPRRRTLLAALALLGGGAVATRTHAAVALPVQGFKVVQSYPHDPDAFTQGLFFHAGHLYESTGLRGRSTIRRVEITTGRVLQAVDLPPEVFGEGITRWGDRLIALSWQEQTAFVLDLKTFKLWRKFSYAGEGWGLANSERELIMSDGTAELRLLDPLTFKELRRLRVTAAGRPVAQLNELEWVDGQIWANVWQTDRIARIDPSSGRVLGWIDLTGLLPAAQRTGHDDVLNGIAYDAAAKRLFVTGKLWPRLFEIQLTQPR
ncbi:MULTISPECIES: glutaminyl-peptide cyclotransferase [unclassified Roseateles]|uniref:glutaminyl-peptide cyclotransferase n=1 Tax=unclassified Roseateles TaxID=2626991 RepID=UPI00070198E9|nr:MULTISPECIES: glutaminyl-peptide cyclotransferase [unclassified Roseateles]KQW43383.1 glutamine cyclotransferase [Pelomonas sp. Root405]KRA71121.1 glutamine cyclotransferase [Pelomonas sp. Root662]